MKMKALVDASSAILLFKAGAFDLLAEAYKLSLVPAVFEEVCVPGRQGAEYFTQAYEQGTLSLVYPNPAAGRRLFHEDRHLGLGERQTLLAFLQGMAAFILLDDRRAAQFCQARAIPFINALLGVKILNLRGYLPDRNYERVFSKVVRTGYYSPWVIDYAADFNHHMLRRFHRRIIEAAPYLLSEQASCQVPAAETASR